MAGPLLVLGIVSLALLGVLGGGTISAIGRRIEDWADERDRRRPYDHERDSGCDVGLSIGSDAVPASPFGAGGASPAGGEPGAGPVLRLVRDVGLVAFVQARGLLAEAIAMASDADLIDAASATFGRSGIGGELHAACVAELDARVVRRIEACRG